MKASTLRHANDARAISIMGDVYRYLVTGAETNGEQAVLDCVIGPGGGPPPHTHTNEDETFVVLEGRVTFLIGDKEVVAGPGTCVFAPRGQRHRFTNRESTPARFILTLSPAGLEDMFAACGVEVPPGTTAPAPVTDEMIGKVMAACPKYGLMIEPPQ
ncbi:cupin domain-containing protein [Nostoc sp. CHAB 5715]|uniref:cupin domain-containing protein n=1 Tax=Nostoc sp. CHAB 5715 TaxID=2780400 RepID=UPI001E3C6136|nr:cupin domain-containing protein [Nostoc sp. CHAB 5715]MCC5621601.1 cupin domain-containing protein [Nostoc sp. CHAB 5715]